MSIVFRGGEGSLLVRAKMCEVLNGTCTRTFVEKSLVASGSERSSVDKIGDPKK